MDQKIICSCSGLGVFISKYEVVTFMYERSQRLLRIPAVFSETNVVPHVETETDLRSPKPELSVFDCWSGLFGYRLMTDFVVYPYNEQR